MQYEKALINAFHCKLKFSYETPCINQYRAIKGDLKCCSEMNYVYELVIISAEDRQIERNFMQFV